MVCENITLKMLLAMAINPSSLHNGAGCTDPAARLWSKHDTDFLIGALSGMRLRIGGSNPGYRTSLGFFFVKSIASSQS